MWLLKPIDSSNTQISEEEAFSITVMLVGDKHEERQEHKRELPTNLALKRLTSGRRREKRGKRRDKNCHKELLKDLA